MRESSAAGGSQITCPTSLACRPKVGEDDMVVRSPWGVKRSKTGNSGQYARRTQQSLYLRSINETKAIIYI
jgi:hypothetical protein